MTATSNSFHVITAPPISSVEARFVYDRWVPDETVDDVNADDVRRVVLTFTTADTQPGSVDDSFDLTQHAGHIQDVSDLVGGRQVAINVSYDKLGEQLFSVVSGAITQHASYVNSKLDEQVVSVVSDAVKHVTKASVLFDVAAKFSVDEGLDDEDAAFVADAMNRIAELNTQYEDVSEDDVVEAFKLARRASVVSYISSRHIERVVRRSTTDPLVVNADDLLALLPTTATLQVGGDNERMTLLQDSTEIAATPFQMRPVYEVIPPPRSSLVGFIVRRRGVSIAGERLQEAQYVVPGGSVRRFVDKHVRYGAMYSYTVSPVYRVDTSVVHAGAIWYASFLLTTPPSPPARVECVETTPPQPPADVDVGWDRTRGVPYVVWTFPPNPQRDIVRFQVFKRTSLDEPFTLVAEYDFDTSETRMSTGEVVPDSARVVTSEPITLHFDQQFDRTKPAVYTVCSVDAHGMVSNYSTQVVVSFDPVKGGLTRRVLSRAGAPRAYPNMYVEQFDVVDSVVRDSGHTRMRCYLTPTARKVRVAGSVVDPTKRKYVVQVVNVDIPASEQFVIDVVE